MTGILFLLVLITLQTHAFIPGKRARGPSSTAAFQAKKNQDMGVSLSGLLDFASDGKYLREAVSKWLDEEWIVLDIHRKLGYEVESCYIHSRSCGVSDLGEMVDCNIRKKLPDYYLTKPRCIYTTANGCRYIARNVQYG